MHTSPYPQETALTLPSYLRSRQERPSEPVDPPIDLAQVHRATNGGFVVEWELGLGA